MLKVLAKYAPREDSDCACAVSDGDHVRGDAKPRKILDGKLSPNYNASVQKT